jgi:hypothetical protein
MQLKDMEGCSLDVFAFAIRYDKLEICYAYLKDNLGETVDQPRIAIFRITI